jgi:hypothetical protein
MLWQSWKVRAIAKNTKLSGAFIVVIIIIINFYVCM